MDRPTRHRFELAEDVVESDELPEASADDVLAVDELPEAAPEDVQDLDDRPARATSTLSDPKVKKTFPLRLSAMEREEGKRAAGRMPLGTAARFTFERKPWTEADWWRKVGLDWANVVNALPEGAEGFLPSRELKRLQGRIAELERGASDAMPELRWFPGLELEPTPAMLTGDAKVSQCAGCGLLVCTTSASPKRHLGACPACDGQTWWRQTLPVGPFRKATSEGAGEEKQPKKRSSSKRRARP